jgi:hypothetical protein
MLAGTPSIPKAVTSYLDPETTDFAHAWVGMEPTFQTEKSVVLWRELAGTQEGEDSYFENDYMLNTEKEVASAIARHYREKLSVGGDEACPFARVELSDSQDPWGTRQQKLEFFWPDESVESFEACLGMDPETFEYGVKPVPLAWFYDQRFVRFLEEFIWGVPQSLGLSGAIAHGGGQFHLSAKTYLTGSLLADEIGYRLNHPELALWIMGFPEPDSRPFRATSERRSAFENILKQYWAGQFHPRANGVLTPENCYLDRGFGPAASAADSLMDARGPAGDATEVFQTNFAFGRTVRWQAQNIHPGYWQSAHPRDKDGYRTDQIMRYSEGNLNRLEIAGQLHVKKDTVLEPERVPELNAMLTLDMLATQASWENRAQMSRTSATDYVEALLLEVHHAQYLQGHPHVAFKASLLQDQLLSDAEKTIQDFGKPSTLAELHEEARTLNLEASQGRIKSDWIEPEVLFWAAWKALPTKEKAAIANEIISGFLERVEQAHSVDPRGPAVGDPMEWHRHRIHPELWKALEDSLNAGSTQVTNEFNTWRARKELYLARRPVWSQDKENIPPWK